MKNAIIVISGPTASGKTKKAVEICKEINGEIISCDSRQVYKYLDVGTSKEGVFIQDGIREIDGIQQFLTDIIKPNENYNAVKFVKDADLKILETVKNGKIPVVVGGTGLYIKALLYGLDEMPKTDEFVRKGLKNKSQSELYEALLKLDPIAAEKNKKNPQRLIRSLEISMLSGKTAEALIKPKALRYNFEHYSLVVGNETLYNRINLRCKVMIEKGMIEETIKILDMGYDKNCPALSGIGYKHVIQYLDKKISKEELIIAFAKDTRHYAKRQKTWFKAQPDIKFVLGFKNER